MTDSLGRKVDFKNTIIIMTSNIGTRQLKDFGAGVGFGTKARLDNADYHTKSVIENSLKKTFAPEFLNRIDEVIRFRPLKAKDLQQIIRLYLADLTNLLAEQGLELRVDDSTVEALALQGYEPEYGARPLRRVLRRQLENPLATRMLEEQFKDMSAIRVKPSEDESDSLLFFGEN